MSFFVEELPYGGPVRVEWTDPLSGSVEDDVPRRCTDPIHRSVSSALER